MYKHRFLETEVNQIYSEKIQAYSLIEIIYCQSLLSCRTILFFYQLNLKQDFQVKAISHETKGNRRRGNKIKATREREKKLQIW